MFVAQSLPGKKDHHLSYFVTMVQLYFAAIAILPLLCFNGLVDAFLTTTQTTPILGVVRHHHPVVTTASSATRSIRHYASRSSVLRATTRTIIDDVDFLALGLGGTNMMCMLWSLAMGCKKMCWC